MKIWIIVWTARKTRACGSFHKERMAKAWKITPTAKKTTRLLNENRAKGGAEIIAIAKTAG